MRVCELDCDAVCSSAHPVDAELIRVKLREKIKDYTDERARRATKYMDNKIRSGGYSPVLTPSGTHHGNDMTVTVLYIMRGSLYNGVATLGSILSA